MLCIPNPIPIPIRTKRANVRFAWNAVSTWTWKDPRCLCVRVLNSDNFERRRNSKLKCFFNASNEYHGQYNIPHANDQNPQTTLNLNVSIVYAWWIIINSFIFQTNFLFNCSYIHIYLIEAIWQQYEIYRILFVLLSVAKVCIIFVSLSLSLSGPHSHIVSFLLIMKYASMDELSKYKFGRCIYAKIDESSNSSEFHHISNQHDRVCGWFLFKQFDVVHIENDRLMQRSVWFINDR